MRGHLGRSAGSGDWCGFRADIGIGGRKHGRVGGKDICVIVKSEGEKRLVDHL